MAKLPRVTAKIFASNAAAGDIGQFGSALAGTKVATGDISQIQALSAYTTGWRGAVISDRNYPTLQEMNGLQKTFSQQIAYILESGIPEYDSATTYYQYEFCRVNNIIYYSLIDNNTNNAPASNTDKWAVYNPGANLYALKDLSNLSSDGNDFINQSKAMTTGSVSDNAIVYADILSRLHTSFDLSKFTVTGSPTITDNGIASGLSDQTNYIRTSSIPNPTKSLEIHWKGTYKSGSNNLWGCLGGSPVLSCGQLNGVTIRVYNAGGSSTFNINIGDTALVDDDDLEVIFKLTPTTRYLKVITSKFGLKETTQTGTYTLNTLGVLGVGSGYNAFYSWLGTIDLKQFSVKVDGSLVFTGNKTGSDSYTVDGETVTIPYTLTSGGAKIADATSYFDIKAVFEAGFTDEQYLTIDEDGQQFTLPQGMSVYEGIGNCIRRIDRLTTRYVVETYESANGYYGYTLYSDKWCEQWCGYSDTTNGNVNLMKQYKNGAYTALVAVYGGNNVYCAINNKSETGFFVAANANTYYNWFTCGYVA